MGIVITPYTEDTSKPSRHSTPGLRAGGAALTVSRKSHSSLAAQARRPQDLSTNTTWRSTRRGAWRYILKHQPFFVGGAVMQLAAVSLAAFRGFHRQAIRLGRRADVSRRDPQAAEAVHGGLGGYRRAVRADARQGRLEHLARAVLLSRAAPGAVPAQYRVPAHQRRCADLCSTCWPPAAWARWRCMPTRLSRPAGSRATGRASNSRDEPRSVPGPTRSGRPPRATIR